MWLPGTKTQGTKTYEEAQRKKAADAAASVNTAATNQRNAPAATEGGRTQSLEGRQDNVAVTPSAAPQMETYSGLLSNPGEGELFWDATKQQWQQPAPEEDWWARMQREYEHPSAAETNLGKDAAASRAEVGHGAYDEVYGAFQGDLLKPGQNEQSYERNRAALGAPGVGETAINDSLNQLAGPGAMENWWAQHQHDLDGPGALERQSGRVQADIDAARSVEGFNRRNLTQLEMPGYTERMAGAYRDTPSASENFYTGGGVGEGLDRLYNRLYDQGSRKMGTEAAARGGWNSGAALRGTEELSRDMNAAHVKDQMAAADQADRQKMARYGEGRQLMTGADSALNNRLSTGGTLTRSQDDVALSRAKAEQDLYTGVGTEKRSNLTTSGSLAGDSQDAALKRLTERGTLGTSSSDAALKRLQEDRIASGAAQDARDKRINTGLDAGAQKDIRRDATRKAAGDADTAAEVARQTRLQAGGTASSTAGQGQRGRLSGGQVASNSAQAAKEGRIRDKFEEALALGDKQAQTMSTAMDKARAEQYDATVASYKLQLQSGTIDQAKYERLIADAERIKNAPRTAAEIYAAGQGLSTPPGMPAATPPPREPEGHAVTDLAAGR